jgi:hypothetical protein
VKSSYIFVLSVVVLVIAVPFLAILYHLFLPK